MIIDAAQNGLPFVHYITCCNKYTDCNSLSLSLSPVSFLLFIRILIYGSAQVCLKSATSSAKAIARFGRNMHFCLLVHLASGFERILSTLQPHKLRPTLTPVALARCGASMNSATSDSLSPLNKLSNFPAETLADLIPFTISLRR